MAAGTQDPPTTPPEGSDSGPDSEEWLSENPEDLIATPIFTHSSGYPHTVCVQMGMALRGMVAKPDFAHTCSFRRPSEQSFSSPIGTVARMCDATW